ncbi:MAG: hypothetical protein ACI9QC_000872 [Oceanicoccus sp.]|jgi:hypothetical protein
MHALNRGIMKLVRCALPLALLSACAGELPADPEECLSELLDFNSNSLPTVVEDADLICYGTQSELAEYTSDPELCEAIHRVSGALIAQVNIGDLRKADAGEHAFVGMYKCDDEEQGAIYGSALAEVYEGPVLGGDNEFLLVSSVFDTDCLPGEVITLEAYLVKNNAKCSGVSMVFSAEVNPDGSSTVEFYNYGISTVRDFYY